MPLLSIYAKAAEWVALFVFMICALEEDKMAEDRYGSHIPCGTESEGNTISQHFPTGDFAIFFLQDLLSPDIHADGIPCRTKKSS